MSFLGLFKKKGRSATDTIDLTRMQSVKDKLAGDAASQTAASAMATPAMDLPMGTFDSSVSSEPSSYPSYSQPQNYSNEDRLISKISALTQRIDLIEHKVDRLERKTGIKSETDIA
jgi:hypothetical protein